MKRIFVLGKHFVLAALLIAGLSITISSCSEDVAVPQKHHVEEIPDEENPDEGDEDENPSEGGEENPGEGGEENPGGNDTPNPPVEEEGYVLDLSTALWNQFCDVTNNDDGSVTLTMSKGDEDWKKGEFGFIIPAEAYAEKSFKSLLIKYKDATESAGVVGSVAHFDTDVASWQSGETANVGKLDIIGGESVQTLVVGPESIPDGQKFSTIRLYDYPYESTITIISVTALEGTPSQGGDNGDNGNSGDNGDGDDNNGGGDENQGGDNGGNDTPADPDAPTIVSGEWVGDVYVFTGSNLANITRGKIVTFSIDINKDADDGFTISDDGTSLTLATPVACTATFAFYVEGSDEPVITLNDYTISEKP